VNAEERREAREAINNNAVNNMIDKFKKQALYLRKKL
jgi:hypothetical protein